MAHGAHQATAHAKAWETRREPSDGGRDEVDRAGVGGQAGGCCFGKQLFDSLAAHVAIVQRPAVDIHAHELIGERAVHAAGPPTVRPAPLGKLVVATTPYSDVYNGARKLGQTPFELDIAAGTYTLTFKNPSRATTTRTVKIVAGKPTRLKFDLPR
jgi:hypothetical protein